MEYDWNNVVKFRNAIHSNNENQIFYDIWNENFIWVSLTILPINDWLYLLKLWKLDIELQCTRYNYITIEDTEKYKAVIHLCRKRCIETNCIKNLD